MAKNKGTKASKKAAAQNNTHSVVPTLRIRADYFARYRFNLEELISYLKGVSGQSYYEAPFAFQCLDDLGYWSFVRKSSVFQFSESLECSLRNQFQFLSHQFNYSVGDALIWGDRSQLNPKKCMVRLQEKLHEGDQDLYRIEVLDTGATLMVSRYELDFWNAAGATLPVDFLTEVVDWDRDLFWLQHLNNFKEFMVSQNFVFDFLKDSQGLKDQQVALLIEVRNYFSLAHRPSPQRERGIGLFACGFGSFQEESLVMALAIQALGQAFGISARLWGKLDGFKEEPSFTVLRPIGIDPLEADLYHQILSSDSMRPIQRPLSEVLRKTLAKGPFGRPESLNLVHTSSPSIEQESQNNQSPDAQKPSHGTE